MTADVWRRLGLARCARSGACTQGSAAKRGSPWASLGPSRCDFDPFLLSSLLSLLSTPGRRVATEIRDSISRSNGMGLIPGVLLVQFKAMTATELAILILIRHTLVMLLLVLNIPLHLFY